MTTGNINLSVVTTGNNWDSFSQLPPAGKELVVNWEQANLSNSGSQTDARVPELCCTVYHNNSTAMQNMSKKRLYNTAIS